CLPANIPDRITVDVSKLTMGSGIHVKDLNVAEGIKTLNGLEEAVVLAVAPTVAVEEKPAAAATEAAAPEGAADAKDATKKEEA
ncbi:MAG TPA: 50S ribosomal protein L25, partial [Bacillota bacterium]